MAEGSNPSSSRCAADSWSCTEVKSIKHSHVWTVKGFSKCDCRYVETTVKPLPSDSNVIFRIRLHPQGNKESNKDFTFFQVFCNKNDTKYRAKFTAFNSRNEECATTIYTGQQQLHGYFEYVRRDLLLNHLQPLDELNLLCEFNITFDTVTRCSHQKASKIEAKELEVAEDLSDLYKTAKMTDFIISCGDRDLLVHKAILCARSPVFAAMLDHNTEEAQNSSVRVDDIDPEVLNEMLHFIYGGRSPNLSEMAPELLAVADRFALPGLKEMAEQVLASHTMPNISFASGGDQETSDFICYVAKDDREVRCCYVLECMHGVCRDVIATIGQAFELRFKEYLRRAPVVTATDRPSATSPSNTASSPTANPEAEYYNDMPGKLPPDISTGPVAASYVPSMESNHRSPRPPCNGFTISPNSAFVPSEIPIGSPSLIDLETEPSPRGAVAQYINDAVDSHRHDRVDFGPMEQPLSPQAEAARNNATLLAKKDWYHGFISREEAEARVSQNGDFLVRRSSKDPNQFVLTGMQDGVVRHLLLIDNEGAVRTLDRKFMHVPHLIEYHQENSLPITSAESAILLRRPILRR